MCQGLHPVHHGAIVALWGMFRCQPRESKRDTTHVDRRVNDGNTREKPQQNETHVDRHSGEECTTREPDWKLAQGTGYRTSRSQLWYLCGRAQLRHSSRPERIGGSSPGTRLNPRAPRGKRLRIEGGSGPAQSQLHRKIIFVEDDGTTEPRIEHSTIVGKE